MSTRHQELNRTPIDILILSSAELTGVASGVTGGRASGQPGGCAGRRAHDPVSGQAEQWQTYGWRRTDLM